MASSDDSLDLSSDLLRLVSSAAEDLFASAKENITQLTEDPEAYAKRLDENLGKQLRDPANYIGGGAAGTIKGALAKTWDAEAARIAASKLAGGANPVNVWRETQTYLNPIDKKFRQEIDDMPAKLKTAVDKEQTVSLDQFLEHPELFKAYPQLQKAQVSLKPGTGREGSFLPSTLDYPAVITVGEKDTLSVLLHEIQHAVQQIEGFSKGSNLDKAAQYIEKKAKPALLKAREVESAKSATLSPAARVELDKTISRLQSVASERPIETYKRSPGENESFMVQRRLDYLPEERRIRPPFLDNLMPWEQMLKDL